MELSARVCIESVVTGEPAEELEREGSLQIITAGGNLSKQIIEIAAAVSFL